MEGRFLTSSIVAIYKNKGDRADCGISLLSVGDKILAKVMLNRLF